MAINTLMGLSRIIRPGFYGENRMYGIPVGDKQNMDIGDAQATYNLLRVFEKFEFFRNVTLQENPRTLDARVTIWENLNVN